MSGRDAFLSNSGYAGAAVDTTDIGGWTVPVPVTRNTGTYGLLNILQPGTRLYYIAAAGTDSATKSVASFYLWDGTNIIDTTGSTTGAGAVAYGTDPLNPTGPILPYHSWNYAGPKQNGEDLGAGGAAGTTTFFPDPTMRLDFPDWWLFKRGETFDLVTDTGSAADKSLAVPGGATEAGPQIVGAYGPLSSARPQFIHGNNGFITRFYAVGRVSFKNAYYLSLRFNGHSRTTSISSETFFYQHHADTVNVLLEDVWFDGCDNTMVRHSGQTTMRRCIIGDAWATGGGHCQGVNASTGMGTGAFKLIDCILYRNGFTTADPSLSWPPSGGTLDWDVFSRNMYLTSRWSHKDSICENTVSLLGGSGDQFRNGMRVNGNFFYNGYVMLNGYGGHDEEPDTGEFRNNVIQCFKATTGSTSAHPSYGLVLGQSAQAVRVNGNIVTRAQCGRLSSATSFAGVWFKVINDDNYYEIAHSLRYNVVSDNIFDCGIATSGVQIDDNGYIGGGSGAVIGWSTPGLNGNIVVRNVFAYSAGTLLVNTTVATGIGSPVGDSIAYPGTYGYTPGVVDNQMVATQSAPNQGTNTGNGTLGTIVAVGTPPTETWVVTFTSATVASVVGSVSGAQANATVGVAYNNGKVSFTMTAGGIAWVAGDRWTFLTVFAIAANDTYVPTTGAAANRTYATMAAALTGEGWANADRTLKSYLQALGVTVTSSDGVVEYITLVATMKRSTWRKDMQAKSIVNYFRQGFNLPALR